MVICIFGESCTGKSMLAKEISKELPGKVFSGKDYLRLAKNEAIAKKMFTNLLIDAIDGENIIYVPDNFSQSYFHTYCIFFLSRI